MTQRLDRARWVAIVGLVAGLVATGLGCGAGSDGDGTGPSTATGTVNGGGGTGAGTGLGGGLGGGFNLGGSTGQGTGCTADLQKTVDADGNIVEICPPDQGCFEGECVPACEAAANAQGSIGCEYWTPNPPFYNNHATPSSYDGACYAVFVANTWGRDAQLTVRYDGQQLDASSFARIPSGVAQNATYAPLPAGGLPPNEVAVLFLSHQPGTQHGLGISLECPVTPAVVVDTAVHNSGRGKAFEVVTDTPITAYDIMPYGGAPSFLPSASLLVPRTAWGDNYVAVSPHFSSNGGQLWVMLVGLQDGTTVDVVPPVTLPGGTAVAQAPANAVTSFTLGAGEILQWMNGDPTGAVFQASAPVGMWTGNTYLRVGSATTGSGGGQDAAHQQMPPISALGHEYVGGHIVTRLSSLSPESVPYRVMGVVDGTQLSWDPTPTGAPSTVDAGQAVEFETTAPFVVASQDEDHPFMLTQYMPGTPGSSTLQDCSPTPPASFISCGLGDEEWVVLLPPEQFLSHYVFFADPTYATTNLVLTRVRGSEGFEEVTVDCLGTVSGWQPVGSSGNYEVAHVDLFRGGVGAMPGCDTSRHVATSDGAFGAIVWGTDYYASYGYPAGGNVGVINDVVIVPEPPN